MEAVVIGLGVVGLALLVWRLGGVSSTARSDKGLFVLPSDVVLRAQPLLTDRALSLYNLIRLAVQDHYLVFAQVPLWSIVEVQGEGKTRSQVLRQIALKRVDFVLVHPGSKIVQQVVQLEEDGLADAQKPDSNETIQSVVEAAGMTYRSLHPRRVYTVTELAKILDVGDEESA